MRHVFNSIPTFEKVASTMRLGSVVTLTVMLAALVMLTACTTTTTTVTRTSDGLNADGKSNVNSDAERRAQLRLELAAGYFSRGQYDAALEDIRIALAAKPDMPEAFNLRGLVHAAMGSFEAADESFSRALALKPNDGDTLHNRAWLYCQTRRYGEAMRMFDVALSDPGYRAAVRSHLAKGVCLAQSDRLPEAEASLTRAFELDPGDPTITLNLAEVLFRRGELERARQHIRRINAREEFVNAQTLWLALRIEHRLGNEPGVNEFGRQLRSRFPQSPEALAFDRGQFGG
jgi:type IV pilus assembly protein PilF